MAWTLLIAVSKFLPTDIEAAPSPPIPVETPAIAVVIPATAVFVILPNPAIPLFAIDPNPANPFLKNVGIELALFS